MNMYKYYLFIRFEIIFKFYIIYENVIKLRDFIYCLQMMDFFGLYDGLCYNCFLQFSCVIVREN